MSENAKICFKALHDVIELTKSALGNGYNVFVKPIYEPYWETKIDHYEITLMNSSEEKENVGM